jgi:PIN domain nuclease of toxin-antitoxin system
MRLLLDTCVIIDWLTDSDPFDRNVWDILNDPDNQGREVVRGYDPKTDYYYAPEEK